MRTFSIWHWLILVAVLSFTTLMACGLLLAVWHKGAESSEAATWMQAIGSVGAIVAAFMIADRQHAAIRKFEDDKRKREEARRFEIVKGILARINVVAEEIGKAWGDTDAIALAERHSAFLLDQKLSLDALPVFEIPSADLVIYVTSLPRALDLLVEALKQARDQYLRFGSVSDHLGERVTDRVDQVLELSFAAGAHCDNELSLRQ